MEHLGPPRPEFHRIVHEYSHTPFVSGLQSFHARSGRHSRNSDVLRHGLCPVGADRRAAGSLRQRPPGGDHDEFRPHRQYPVLRAMPLAGQPRGDRSHGGGAGSAHPGPVPPGGGDPVDLAQQCPDRRDAGADRRGCLRVPMGRNDRIDRPLTGVECGSGIADPLRQRTSSR